MRVTVFVSLFSNEKTSSGEISDDVAIGVFDELAGKSRHGVVECGVGVHRVENGEFFSTTNGSIVFAKCGGEMNDA